MLPNLRKFVPAKCTDANLYNQKAPTEVTVDELLNLRKIPEFNLITKIRVIFLAVLFGIPKVIILIPITFISLFIFSALCVVWRALGKPNHLRESLKSLWTAISRVILFCCGISRVTFHGENSQDARFIVANHICFFDGWLFCPFGPRPLGKMELLKIPGLKDMAEIFDGIPVDRSKNNGLTRTLIENAKDSTKPQIMIMPEGATTSGDYMLRFHLGAFLSDLPVQPCTIRYTLYGVTKDTAHGINFFHHDVWMFLAFIGTPFITVDISFLEPMSIKADGDGDPRKFADAVEMAIANALGVRVVSLGTRALFKPKSE